MPKHPAKCPKCGHRVDYESAAGGVLVCPGCQARLRVPGHSQAPSATQVATEAQAPPPPSDPLLGQTLGEFEIVATIGHGGMGAVYKGFQRALNRFVAIKVLPEHLTSDAAFIERFHREARAVAAVRHPNIIEVHTIGSERGYEFIAMEFVDGASLADLLRREGRLAPDRALELMKQVTSALAKAHAVGILHRDIKPANILLTSDGFAKVADFGLAKHEGVDVSVTATGASLGTPLYMPPEVAQGKPADARSDLYSLGATFYQAIAGKPPFDGATPAELIIKHVNTPPPPLHTLAPDCPAALCRIIHRLLSKNPAHRYSSAQKLLDALARIEARVVGGASVPRVSGSVGGASVPRVGDATRTLPGHVAQARAPVPHGKPVGGASLPRVLLIGGAAALVLIVVLVLALGRRGPRPSSSVLPSTRTPTTEHPTPASDALEQHAALCLQYAETCAKRSDWSKAKDYLDDLAGKYAATRFAAENKAAIAALRAQADAALKPTPTPKVEPKGEPAEEWTMLPNGWRVGKPVNLGPVVNSPSDDGNASVSSDGLSLYFDSVRPGSGGKHDLWMSTRRATGEPWGPPASLGPSVNDGAPDDGPCISSDGLELLFRSMRAGGHGGDDLWMCTRHSSAEPWGRPQNLGPPVNGRSYEGHPCLDGAGLTLLFQSHGRGGLGRSDIWMCTRPAKGEPWGAPANLGPPINTGGDEGEPCLSPDGLTLFFKANRPGGLGKGDLWMSTRRTTAEPFGEPVNLGPTVNTGAANGGPALSADCRTLYFQSDHYGGQGNLDLWQAPLLPPGVPVPAPPPDDDERWTEWEELFDGESLKGWEIPERADFAGHGKVDVRDQQIVLGPGQGHTGIQWTGTLPGTDYEIQYEVMRLTGYWSLGELLFPLGSSGCLLHLGDRAPPVVGLCYVDGKGSDANETTRRMQFPPHTWHRVRVRVTEAKIEAWVGDERIVDLGRRGHQITHPKGKALRIALWTERTLALRNIRLRRLKPEAPPPDDDARWGPWEELFDGKSLDGWRVITDAPEFAKHGKVIPRHGELVLEEGDPATGIVWTRDAPRVGYEVSFEAMFRGRNGTMCHMVFPYKTTECGFHVGGWENTVVCLDRVDGRYDLVRQRMAVEEGRWHRVRLRVTEPRIEAWVDDVKAIDFDPQGHTLSLIDLHHCMTPLGLRCWKATTALRGLRLRRLKPEGAQAPKAGAWKVYTEWPFDEKESKRRQEETAKALGVPVERDIDLGNGVKMTMVLIPAGEFLMGSPPTTSPEQLQKRYVGRPEWYEREFPQHRVMLTKPFWLGKTEVTQEQWQAVMGSNPSKSAGRPQNPVEQVSWDDCHGFLNKLSAKLNKPFRLPTEAQWEYACRAGAPTEFFYGDDAKALAGYVWWRSISGGSAQPVGRKKPNAWGLYDMAGNVFEWCEDRFALYEGRAQSDPKGPQSGTMRVVRGGSWYHSGLDVFRCASRSRNCDPSTRSDDLGFRAAMAIDAVPRPQGGAEAPRPAAQKLIAVRQDGKGDFTSIQAAIDAAEPGSVVEIQDDGPYNEPVIIPQDKPGITLRGQEGRWPIITSEGPVRGADCLVAARAEGATIERLVLLHSVPTGAYSNALALHALKQRARLVLAYMVKPPGGSLWWTVSAQVGRQLPGPEGQELVNCLVALGGLNLGEPRVALRDSIVFTGQVHLNVHTKATLSNVFAPSLFARDDCATELSRCTVPGRAMLTNRPNLARDCILGSIASDTRETTIEHCNVFGVTLGEVGQICFTGHARPGKGCFSEDPQFRDPDNFDYRLKPTSPCRGKASDGGDIGCRYTPEMIELLEKALELRKKGIIKF